MSGSADPLPSRSRVLGVREALGEDAVAEPSWPLLSQATTKSPSASGRHRRAGLVVGGVGVDLELAGQRRAPALEKRRAKTPSIEPSWLRLRQATTKSPSASAATDGAALGAGGVGVDLELAGESSAGAREAAGEDAVARAVLAVALPGDDEVAVGVHRHRRDALVVRGVGVDLELAGQRSARAREAAGEDAVVRAVLAERWPRRRRSRRRRPPPATARYWTFGV